MKVDVPRTQPNYPLFQTEQIQQMLKRLLYIWSFRKPACGYVQGINEIATPFIAVFLSEYIEIDFYLFDTPKNMNNLTEEMLFKVEADTFWCMS